LIRVARKTSGKKISGQRNQWLSKQLCINQFLYYSKRLLESAKKAAIKKAASKKAASKKTLKKQGKKSGDQKKIKIKIKIKIKTNKQQASN